MNSSISSSPQARTFYTVVFFWDAYLWMDYGFDLIFVIQCHIQCVVHNVQGGTRQDLDGAVYFDIK